MSISIDQMQKKNFSPIFRFSIGIVQQFNQHPQSNRLQFVKKQETQ